MQAYRVETTVQQDGALTLEHLPFKAGEAIEVIILSRTNESDGPKGYSLRGTPFQYARPFDPVAEDDWEAAL